MPGFVGAVTPRQFPITIWMTYSKVRARLAARRQSEYDGQEVMGLPHVERRAGYTRIEGANKAGIQMTIGGSIARLTPLLEVRMQD